MAPPAIQLSTSAITFSADDPGSWEPVLEFVDLCDAAGVDRIAVSDHIVFGEHLEEYGRPEIGGQKGGRQPTGPDGHWLEPLTFLSVVAGRTRSIRLATYILVAPLRRPVVLAKTLSTLDVLSGGRVDLGVGIGWQREEYEAAGLDFEGRGRLLDHTLEVLQTFWREPRARYDSPELSFDAIHMMPKPLQPGGVPVWVSGTVNKRVASRIARFGSGWIPWGDAMLDPVAGIAQMRELLADLDFDASELQIVGNLDLVKRDDGSIDLDRTMEVVPALAAAGVTDARTRFPLPADPGARAELLHSTVAAFRAAAGRPQPA